MSKLSRWVDKYVTHKSAYRQEMEAVNQQLDLYQKEKDRMHAENEKLATEKANEQKLLHEKQIRAMRRKYRAPGFLEQPSGDTAQTLG